MRPDESWFTDRRTDGADRLRSRWASVLVTFVAMCCCILNVVNTTLDRRESMRSSYADVYEGGNLIKCLSGQLTVRAICRLDIFIIIISNQFKIQDNKQTNVGRSDNAVQPKSRSLSANHKLLNHKHT